MREILFRGKRNNDDKWVYGFLVSAKHIGDWVLAEPVFPKTVGQFTGLTDKNGKKIFEGDILRFLAYGIVYTGKVEFLNGAFWVKCRFHDRIGAIVHEYKPEIIGNIHDNPELLEVEDGK